ncbi:FAD-dependent oxidoreductase [Salsuginibacillus kocurii]|uniref:FAD-dependent oxidoreductase n=1 Tax=Salsuginibacillus kocurii TaxID=427078 RepID=UPI000370F4EC|nr:FAD-dependent oxidoreductase [Salsuginibacillus kocurii]
MADSFDPSVSMPKTPESYWRKADETPDFPPLKEDVQTSAVIVGGGITGLTTAYLLAKEGMDVTVLEADKLFNGTTGYTTAKITAQHGLIYDELIKHFGEEKAKLYYEANHEGLIFIRDLVEEKGINCDFSEEDAYVYTTDENMVPSLKKELEAYEKLGIKGEFQEESPLPFPVKGALKMEKQAQFHPLRYLNYLVDQIVEMGGKIYEETTAKDIESGDSPSVVTEDNNQVTGEYVIVASHFPFEDERGFYFARMKPEQSYVLAIQAEEKFPPGMYISAEDPKRSLRATPSEDGELILVGGESHKTGQGVEMSKHYEALKSYGHENFTVTSMPYKWATHDLVTLDKVPYIGELSPNQENLFVATGFKKWGMTHGTTAALLLLDLVLERDNEYADLFNPERFQADPSLKELVKENSNVAKEFVKGKMEKVQTKPEDLAKGEGGIVTYDGERAGGYRDENDTLYIVDTTCTHMGCEVEWNDGDGTWDCPCHGSRFYKDGGVINGPATEPLKPLNKP